jgi:hypothetical protein
MMTPFFTLILTVMGMVGGCCVVIFSRRRFAAYVGVLIIFGCPAAMVAYARYRVTHDPRPAPVASSLPSCK